MYSLYYTTRSYTSESTALIPRIALEEIGTPYHVTEVELDPNAPDWFLKLNPHGKIPTLTVSEQNGPAFHIYPSPAILLYLANAHPEANLLPKSDSGRARCFTNLFDMVEMLHSGFMRCFFTERYSSEASHVPAIRQKSLDWITGYISAAEAKAAGSQFDGAGEIAISDIYFYVMLRWYHDLCTGENSGCLKPLTAFQNLHDFCKKMETRPAVLRALDADNIIPIAQGSFIGTAGHAQQQ